VHGKTAHGYLRIACNPNIAYLACAYNSDARQNANKTRHLRISFAPFDLARYAGILALFAIDKQAL
jgi:hypothetical protein